MEDYISLDYEKISTRFISIKKGMKICKKKSSNSCVLKHPKNVSL